jgi:hypothetical protein
MPTLTALALVIALGQNPKAGAVQKPKSTEISYAVQLGASASFHSKVLAVERLLAEKKFPQAGKAGMLLPRSDATVSVSYKNVAPEKKTAFDNAVKFAIDRWNMAIRGAGTVRLVTKGAADIVVSFEPLLAKLPDTGEQAGAAWFYGSQSDQASLEAVIGLKRGAELKPTQDKEVHNEVLFTIGAYFGLGPAGYYGPAMGRIEGEMANLTGIQAAEIERVKNNLRLSKNLRLAALNKVIVKPQEPSLFVENQKFEFGTTLQGNEVIAEMTVANRGNSTLLLAAKGDCSCIGADVVGELKPGATARLRGKYKTMELEGEVLHYVIVESNDPERPLVKIPSRIFVKPRLTPVFPISDVIDLTEELKPFDIYVHSEEQPRPNIVKAMMGGVDMPVTFVDFEGTITDFKKQGAKRSIKGYKFTVNPEKLKGMPVYGRLQSTLFVRTDSEIMPVLRVPIYIQKGIVASPDSLYLGSPVGPVDVTINLSRPGRPYKILKMSAESKHITAKIAKTIDAGEYLIRIYYDGKALEHKIKTTLTIETDDPKQPFVKVPIESSLL